MPAPPRPAADDDYDIQWDPEAMRKYGGNWVVAVGRDVIAFGKDPKAAREEAAAKLGVEAASLTAVAVCTPDTAWLP